jgi:hypothetical protein
MGERRDFGAALQSADCLTWSSETGIIVPSEARQADKGLIYIEGAMRVRTGTVANRALSVANT